MNKNTQKGKCDHSWLNPNPQAGPVTTTQRCSAQWELPQPAGTPRGGRSHPDFICGSKERNTLRSFLSVFKKRIYGKSPSPSFCGTCGLMQASRGSIKTYILSSFLLLCLDKLHVLKEEQGICERI